MVETYALRLLEAALDCGVTLFDTARSYGLSEERIGRALAGRRSQYLLSTKVGYGVPGFEDWTGPCVAAGIDLALSNLKTDVLDVVHLHSCPLETLRRGDVVEALARAVGAGKVRVAAYSGENEPLEWAVFSGAFGSVQTSVNACDQRGVLSGLLAHARQRGMAVLAKRALSNEPWRAAPGAGGDSARSAYRGRWRRMALDLAGIEPAEFAIRFTLSIPEVDTAIVGTGSISHLAEILAAARRGPLPPDLVEAAKQAFRENDRGWEGQI
jgi:aryl-alcohol dehydrogenase-like predicted oxidoreductase